MTTLPEQISDLLSGSSLSTDLGGQIGMIIDAGALLADLIANPPDEIGELVSGLGSTSISSIEIPDALTLDFSTLTDIIPQDLGSVTGGLDNVFGNFDAITGEETLANISRYVGCLQAVAALFAIDFSLFNFGSSSGSSSSGTATSSSAGSGSASSSAGSGGTGGSGSAGSSSGSGTGSGEGPAGEEDLARTQNLETVRSMRGVLDTFPEPFNAENVVRFLSAKLQGAPRHNVKMQHLPFYDDLHQLLKTMIQFSDITTPAAMQSHIQTTLTALKTALERDGLAPMDSLTTTFSGLATKIDSTALQTEMDQLSAVLQNIAVVVDGADISGIDADVGILNTTLDSLLPRLTQMQNDVFGGAAAGSITQLQRLPRELDLGMRRLERMLTPSLSLEFLGGIDSLLSQGIEQSNLNEVTSAIADLYQRITGTLEALNSATLQTAFGTISDALDAALDGFDDAMLQFAVQVSALFDEVDGALARIDTASFREQIERAIQEVQVSLEETVRDLFEPVRDAVSTAVSTIESTVSSFDPDAVAGVLRDVIGQITDVLTSEEVTNALSTISGALERVTQQIQALSFTPVADEVIDGIDHITETLQGIDPSEINAVTKGAIQVAVEVLPEDLAQPRNYLVGELDRIMDEGPIPLIEQIKAPVESLTDQIQSLSPEKLIGDSLSAPFDNFIAELDKFSPSSLLMPVENALDGIKDTVRDQIDLAKLLKPLEDLYNDLLSQMDRLGPAQLIDPIEEQIAKLIDKLLAVLPEEVIFEVLDTIISGIEYVTDLVTEVKLILTKVRTMVTALANPEVQLRSWLQPVLDLVDGLPDITDLQDLFDDVSQAVDKLTAAELQSVLRSSLDPIINGITDLEPQALLGKLSSAFQNIDSAAVDALPDSTQKTALLAALDRFNPLSPPMSRVFTNLQQWIDNLIEELRSFEMAMTSWDTLFMGKEKPFSALKVSSATTQTIKDLLRDGLEEQAIAPVAKMMNTLGNSVGAFSGPIGELEGFVESIEDMLEQITAGPNSLGDIRDTLNQLVERVRNINLQFLEDELGEIFDALKAKFNAVSPTVFREALQSFIDETLDLVDIALLLPQEDIDTIDQTYQDLIDSLKNFDPSKLVIDAVKPDFDSKVLPILETFDLSEPLDVLIERMNTLAEELGTELTRTDGSYQTMLQAVPV